MSMTLREFFQLRCSEMLVMEQDILRMNNLMAQESKNPRFKEMLQRHTQLTEQQITNLQQVIERLGGRTGPQESLLTQAMMRAHRFFLDTNPQQQLLDLYDALEDDRIEHIEIASYRGLIALAKQLGENEFMNMLQQNLQGEDQMRASIEGNLPLLFHDSGGTGEMAA